MWYTPEPCNCSADNDHNDLCSHHIMKSTAKRHQVQARRGWGAAFQQDPGGVQKGKAVFLSMTDYERIEQAIRYLRTNAHRRPTLADIAHSVHLSIFHFQRLFTRWAGVSPKRFLQYLTIERAKDVLKESPSLLDASFAAGLSGEGRLHDLFVTLEAMTPGEFKRGGRDLRLHMVIIQRRSASAWWHRRAVGFVPSGF
jgi:AraC-like DNA-binding protein